MRRNYIAYDKDVTMKCLCVIGWAPYTYDEIKGAVSLLHPKHEIFVKSVRTGSRMFTTKNRRQRSAQPTNSVLGFFLVREWGKTSQKASKGVFRQNIQERMGELKHYFFSFFQLEVANWRTPMWLWVTGEIHSTQIPKHRWFLPSYCRAAKRWSKNS